MTTSEKATSRLTASELAPFLKVAMGWLALGLATSAGFSTGRAGLAAAWMTAFWLLCVLDLYALSRAVGAVLELAATPGEKRGALTIQASYWGLVKLICLGILIAILSQGRSIPAASLLMGAATLVTVPLIGGYGWSKKVLRHAS